MVTVCYGAVSMKQNFEQNNTTFPEFMWGVVDVTVFDQMSQVVDEPDTILYLQLSLITLEASISSSQSMLH